ncbi:MAG: DsbE family thiol:disulfide interchange protein [Stappiaceae bacterium]
MTPIDTPKASKAGSKPRISVIVLLPLILFMTLSGLFLFQLLWGNDPRQIPSVLINKPAPDFELPPLAGLARGGEQLPGLSKADLLGKVTVLNIWASWCVPCRQEHPFLIRLAEDKRINLVGLNYKDKPENALGFLSELGNPYSAVGIDEKGRAGIDWGVYGVPETFIVGPKGMIRYKYIGPLTAQSYETTFIPSLNKVLALSKEP